MPRPPINAKRAAIGTAEEIAAALPKCRKSGSGYVACCPAHQDDNPSLSITERDGKPLVCCHAGCPQDAVISALRALNLWPEREHQSDGDIEAIYNYTDEQGTLLYQVVRKAGKKFLQRRPDGAGGWIWRKHPQQVRAVAQCEPAAKKRVKCPATVGSKFENYLDVSPNPPIRRPIAAYQPSPATARSARRQLILD